MMQPHCHPFNVVSVRFWLSDQIGLPDTLSVRVWSGDVSTGPDSEVGTSFLYEQASPALHQAQVPSYVEGVKQHAR